MQASVVIQDLRNVNAQMIVELKYLYAKKMRPNIARNKCEELTGKASEIIKRNLSRRR